MSGYSPSALHRIFFVQWHLQWSTLRSRRTSAKIPPIRQAKFPLNSGWGSAWQLLRGEHEQDFSPKYSPNFTAPPPTRVIGVRVQNAPSFVRPCGCCAGILASDPKNPSPVCRGGAVPSNSRITIVLIASSASRAGARG